MCYLLFIYYLFSCNILPVHKALKLSHVLGQMSANSSKIILPAGERMGKGKTKHNYKL